MARHHEAVGRGGVGPVRISRMLDADETDVTRHCGSGASEAGRRYHRQARVVEFSRDGDTIRSAVKGSMKALCRQTIALTERRDGVGIAGRCTCPMQANCNHVVAALYDAMALASAARAVAAHPRAEPEFPIGLQAWLDDLARAAGSSGATGSSFRAGARRRRRDGLRPPMPAGQIDGPPNGALILAPRPSPMTPPDPTGGGRPAPG